MPSLRNLILAMVLVTVLALAAITVSAQDGENTIYTDGRLNPQPGATAILYCNEGIIDVYELVGSQGVLTLRVAPQEVALADSRLPDIYGNTLIKATDDKRIRLYRLANGWFQLNAPAFLNDPYRAYDPNGYVFMFPDCPGDYYNNGTFGDVPVVVNCYNGVISVYQLIGDQSYRVIYATPWEINRVGVPPAFPNLLIEQSRDQSVRLYRLVGGWFQVNAPIVDEFGLYDPNGYVFIFQDCPSGYYDNVNFGQG